MCIVTSAKTVRNCGLWTHFLAHGLQRRSMPARIRATSGEANGPRQFDRQQPFSAQWRHYWHHQRNAQHLHRTAKAQLRPCPIDTERSSTTQATLRSPLQHSPSAGTRRILLQAPRHLAQIAPQRAASRQLPGVEEVLRDRAQHRCLHTFLADPFRDRRQTNGRGTQPERRDGRSTSARNGGCCAWAHSFRAGGGAGWLPPVRLSRGFLVEWEEQQPARLREL